MVTNTEEIKFQRKDAFGFLPNELALGDLFSQGRKLQQKIFRKISNFLPAQFPSKMFLWFAMTA